MNTKVAKKNNKGFTLIELIVVIAIIAVLAAILAPQYLRYVEKSRIAADCQAAAEIQSATKTAAADPDVFDKIAHGETITWTPRTGAIVEANGPTGDGSALQNEVTQNVGTSVKGKSKAATATGVTFICTLDVNTANQSITLNSTWDGITGATLTSMNNKSGANGVKGTTTKPEQPDKTETPAS